MKKAIVLIISILVCLNYTFSQKIDGKYFENSDYIEFKNDSADFKISSSSGLTNLHGAGVYDVIDEFLLIMTCYYKGLNSCYEKTKKENGLSQITVVAPDNKPIIGVNLILTDKKGTLLFSTATNEDGQATFKNAENADKLILALIGYDTYTIDYSDNFDYQVILMDYEVIENETVVFKINSINPDTLNLTLLSTIFKSKGNRKKDLIKIERKYRKYKFKERLLRKQ